MAFYSTYTIDTLDDSTFPTDGEKYTILADITAPVLDVKYYNIGFSAQKFFPWEVTILQDLKVKLVILMHMWRYTSVL